MKRRPHIWWEFEKLAEVSVLQRKGVVDAAALCEE